MRMIAGGATQPSAKESKDLTVAQLKGNKLMFETATRDEWKRRVVQLVQLANPGTQRIFALIGSGANIEAAHNLVKSDKVLAKADAWLARQWRLFADKGSGHARVPIFWMEIDKLDTAAPGSYTHTHSARIQVQSLSPSTHTRQQSHLWGIDGVPRRSCSCARHCTRAVACIHQRAQYFAV